MLYTQDGQEITEPLSADLFKRNLIDTAHVESNAGGRAFARAVQRHLEAERSQVKVRWFTQTKNKEARIITNSSQARQSVLFPRGWRTRWPEFSRHILEFRKVFRSNSHDDAADALTGIIETSPLVHSFGFVL
jgi:predicted phage terminase large subunit-like protein